MSDIERGSRPPIQRRRQVGAIEYALFDLDGTLLDDMGPFSEVFASHVERYFGIPPKVAATFFLRTLGIPTHRQVEQIVGTRTGPVNNSETTQERFLEVGGEIDRQLTEVTGPPFPEVPRELAKLRREGTRMAISSSHGFEVIERKLEIAGLSRYFEALFEGDLDQPDGTKNHHISQAAEYFGVRQGQFARRAAYVGDSESDMRLAARNGVKGIGRVGTRTKKQLEAAGAFVTVNDLEGIVPLIRVMAGMNKPLGHSERARKEAKEPIEAPTEVLDGLVDIASGRLIAPQLKDTLVNNPPKNIVVIGPAGIGKSTIVSQLAAEIEKLRPDYKINFPRYDKLLAETEKERGLSGHWEGDVWVETWSGADYAVLNRKILRELRKGGNKAINIAEFPAVGDQQRGQDALRELGEIVPGTLVIGLAYNPETMSAAMQVREGFERGNIQDVDVERYLREEHRIEFVGFAKRLTAKERGKRIKDVFGLTGKPKDILRIRDEITEKIRELRVDSEFSTPGRREGSEVSHFVEMLEAFPDGDRELIIGSIQYYLSLGFDFTYPMQVVYNPLITGTIHMYVPGFFQNRIKRRQ